MSPRKANWNAQIYAQDWISEVQRGFKQSDLASQCDHRYKVYIEGSAWSVSEKYILAFDSPALVVTPRYYDFFTRGLMPGQHYWPIRDDDKCRSIKFAVDWGNTHQREAQDIGKAASSFIQEELKMDHVYDYILHLLTEYGKLQKFKPRIHGLPCKGTGEEIHDGIHAIDMDDNNGGGGGGGTRNHCNIYGCQKWLPLSATSMAFVSCALFIGVVFTTFWIIPRDYNLISFSLMRSNNAPTTPTHPIKPFTCSSGNLTAAATCNPPSSATPPPIQSRNPTCPDYFRWIHEDLKPWKSTGISRQAVELANKTATFRLVILDGRAYVEAFHKSFQTRDLFTMWGVVQLLRRYPGRVPDLDLMFDCGDRPVIKSSDHHHNLSSPPPPLFQYCGDESSVALVFPDWSFWGWVEVNIKPWEVLMKEMKVGNKRLGWIDRIPYAYWKGNPTVAPTRGDLIRFYDFFTRGLMPGHHYWPIRDDNKCRDIKFAVDWGNTHKKEAQAIGKAGSRFILEELKMDYVYDYMFHFLREYAKLLKYKPTKPPKAKEICVESMACAAKGREREYMMASMMKANFIKQVEN
ncbi:hypothetical protein QJS10_CPB18g01547 [Acorus calamus]|uniref:Glycosyl transferase CAP10 domain-containing protein n=1 Tax=Acorus calamus TaxID=4465 RepID=A0AAV9CQM6_ACOCL|nr:hypothetical protein QJS10_CPB18g01547 [Acorus calamus]